MIYSRKIYLKQLIDSQGNGMIKTVTGIRRCGKSVLLMTLFKNHLIESGVPESSIIELSMEDRKNMSLRNPDTFLDFVNNRIIKGQDTYMLIDEVQMIDEFVEVLLSLMHITGCDIYVTGSNSLFLSSDIVTEFRGRSQEIHIQPLSFAEFMEGYNGNTEDGWKEYYEFGGLPQIPSFKGRREKIDYLTNLISMVYLKDVIERNRIQENAGLTDLLRILASSIGSPSNPSRISNTYQSILGKKLSDDTVTKYIKYLKESFLLYDALRYDVKGRKYIGTETKYYFSDIGLRNSIIDFRQIEENHSMENIIFNELKHRGYNVDVGLVEMRERNEEGHQIRKKLEVDFVANQGSQRYYIQSAFKMDNGDKEKQELKSLKHIPDSFKKLIIVRDNIVPYHDENGFIRMGLFDFLLNPASLNF